MKVILISDSHLAAVARPFLDNCRAAASWIDDQAPDLVVHLGDVTADGAKDSDHFAAAASALSAIRSPLRILPGNHDIGDNPPHGGGDEPAFSAARLALFRRALGPDRWVERRDGWTLIGLNNQLFGSGDPDEVRQWVWLDETLREAAGPIGLFTHKPLFGPDLAADDDHPRFAPPAARRMLAERLAGLDLRFVASGHVHQARRLEREGVLHLWAPSCAFILPDTVQSRIGDKVVGVMTLHLQGREVEAQVAVPPGVEPHDVFDHPEIYPQVAAVTGAARSGDVT